MLSVLLRRKINITQLHSQYLNLSVAAGKIHQKRYCSSKILQTLVNKKIRENRAKFEAYQNEQEKKLNANNESIIQQQHNESEILSIKRTSSPIFSINERCSSTNQQKAPPLPSTELNKCPLPAFKQEPHPLSSSASPKRPQPPPSQPPSQNNKNYLWIALAATAGGLALAYYQYQSHNEPQLSSEAINKKAKKKENARVPPNPEDIPKQVPYLLVGGGTASFAAFRAIKSNNPKAKVMVITNELEMPYMRPPLSKELWLSYNTEEPEQLKFKQWNGDERSLYYEPNEFYQDPIKLMEEPNGGVSIVRGYTVKYIDICNRKAVLTDGTEIEYEECLLATGSEPKNLDIFSEAPNGVREKVSVFKSINDFENLREKIDKKINTIAVIGGGFLGSELSCALASYGEKKNLKVYQIFHEKGNMGKVLPEYLCEWTTDRVREEGVNVIPATQVTAASVHGKQLLLKLLNGQELLVDHAIVAVGSKPNVQLAKESGLEVDKIHGGYLVNAELEARRHLYVAGDAACFYDTILGRRRIEHHDHAVTSGRLAGENMVGLKKPYKHQSMFWSDLGPKVGYEAIGICDSSLPTVGVFAKASPNDSINTDKLTDLNNQATLESKSTDVKTTENSNNNNLTNSTTANTTTNSSDNNNNNNNEYGKGVIFYLRDNKVVGIVLWNVFNRISIARAIINENKSYDDLNEVAKLFKIHS